ncbi:hypothetical protein GW17_00006801 [Ensete ventricosum]|nr:hypothetical protein GW17_00006801 [Ensete ventricosum]
MKTKVFHTDLYRPYRAVRTGPSGYQYVDYSPVVGGTAKIDRRRSIEGEIDHRRSIEREKGKKQKRKRRKKKKRRRRIHCVVLTRAPLPPAGRPCTDPRVIFLSCGEKDQGNWTRETKFPHAVWAAGRALIALLLPNFDVVDNIWLEPAAWEVLVFHTDLYCPYQAARIGPLGYRYADRLLSGGTAKIDRRRSIEREKGKKKKKNWKRRKKRRRREERIPRNVLACASLLPAGLLFVPCGEKDQGDIDGIGCTRISKAKNEGSVNGNLESRSYLEKKLVFCFGSHVASQLLLPFGEENFLSTTELKQAQEVGYRLPL